ncbi:MAG: NUDIX domain-containing protein [Pseudomonadota bacterium]
MIQYDFPRPAVTVDLVAFRVQQDTLELLLIERDQPPFAGRWTLPGAFVHENEPLETTASRILQEKAHLEGIYLEQLATFGKPGRDPRGHVLSVAYFAIVNAATVDEGKTHWFSVDALPETGFDHDDIIATAVQRLRGKLTYTDIGFAFLPDTFTLTELQKTWQAVLGTPLDKRNFRKSILSQQRVVATGEKSSGGAHPPAMLYRWQPER